MLVVVGGGRGASRIALARGALGRWVCLLAGVVGWLGCGAGVLPRWERGGSPRAPQQGDDAHPPTTPS